MYEAFNDPEVEVILNLTRPHEHYEVTKQGLLHGKHVYSEKPLAVDMDEAKELVALAEEKGLRLGGAPDTFMGAGIQTARRVIDQGLIGDVVGASCAMVCHGHETWHPDPEFYYKRGGGPMLDMGPYYVTALVQLHRPGQGRNGHDRSSTFPHRTITSQPHYGEDVDCGRRHLPRGQHSLLQRRHRLDFHNVSTCTTDAAHRPALKCTARRVPLLSRTRIRLAAPILLLRPEDQAAAPATDPALDAQKGALLLRRV